MDHSYALAYASLASRHWWWLARRTAVLAHLEQLAGTILNPRILDIGCGDGSLLHVLTRYGDAYGIEPDPAVISRDNPCRDRIRIAAFGPVYDDDSVYDLVLMLDVLEHIEDHYATATRLHDILRPEGHAIITVPALPMLWSMHDVVNQHFRRYSRQSLVHVLTAANFEIVSLRFIFGWTALALIFRRLLARAKTDADAIQQFRVSVPPPWINKLLYNTCRIEEHVFSRARLPVGSSLIAVVKRPQADS